VRRIEIVVELGKDGMEAVHDPYALSYKTNEAQHSKQD
jgi:hypothetical protein